MILIRTQKTQKFNLSTWFNTHTLKTLFNFSMPHGHSHNPHFGGGFIMNNIDIFFNSWNRKYPEFAGRIGSNISEQRDLKGNIYSIELVLDFVDEDGDGLYYKVSHMCKMIFSTNVIATYTWDQNGRFIHQFHVQLV